MARQDSAYVSRAPAHIPIALYRWYVAQRAILKNASAVVGSTGLTSVIGAVYWLVAAHLFPANEVGLSAAAISAMTLTSTFSVLGFGTLLIGELPHHRESSGAMISTALLVSGSVGAALGIALTIGVPLVAPDLRVLRQSLGTVSIFAVGAGFASLGLVLDNAVIGLLRGELQLVRNIVLALSKLLLLVFAGIWLLHPPTLIIFATWVFGMIISVGVLTWYARTSLQAGGAYRPQWRLLRAHWGTALRHHALNLALQGASLILPLLVTALLGAELNASFYIAWMIANLVAVGPRALTVVLYAVGAADPGALAQKVRFTLRFSFLLAALPALVILAGAQLVLIVFGGDYAHQATMSLRLLSLGVFPLIIRDHYVTLRRLHQRILSTAAYIGAGCALECAAAYVGGRMGGLSGLCAGWLFAVCVEAVCMIPVVVRGALHRPHAPLTKTHQLGTAHSV